MFDEKEFVDRLEALRGTVEEADKTRPEALGQLMPTVRLLSVFAEAHLMAERLATLSFSRGYEGLGIEADNLAKKALSEFSIELTRLNKFVLNKVR